ncbi:MAG TPA: uracil-DNA glycosylase [Candidatus Limnocylindrales bacterium]|nr:uracil-DNA glycosylase [Candidatus Limnocylindrales bacterium]
MPAPGADTLEAIEREVVVCVRCPRLVAWREQVAHDKVARYREETYWGRPVPGFGDPSARIVLVGLAPGAHGANRTGRMFTGDGSGDFLWPALYAAGLASQPDSRRRDDGLRAIDLWVTAPVRCVPPDNRPLPSERDNCAPYLVRELAALDGARVVIALGAFGWDAALRTFAALGAPVPAPKPRFAHGAEAQIGRWRLLGSYHVSQQNTFTGRLTRPMLDAVFARGVELAAQAPDASR